MTSGRYGLVLRQVGRLLGGGSVAALGPGQLLERFAVDRDEAAFEALVGRHGPMVLGTCRRMLADPRDVDDAFQATFLVLARKAGSIRDADRLGPWLHGVARRVATRSRALSARRDALERSAAGGPAVEEPDLLEAVELRAALDEELARLPEKYRAPLVLCYLEGLTHDEAAEQLRWPVGTVRSRLAGGRERLRARLTRRGLAPSATVPAILPHASIPQALLSATVRVATSAGPAPAHVANLAKGALIAMMGNKLKVVAAVGLMAGLTVGGAGVAAQRGGEAKVQTGPTATNPGEEARLEKELEETIRKIDERRSVLKELDAMRDLLVANRSSSEEPPPSSGRLGSVTEMRDRVKRNLDELTKKAEGLLADRLREFGPSAGPGSTVQDLADKLAGSAGDLEKGLRAANDEIRRLRAELQAARSEPRGIRLTPDAPAVKVARASAALAPAKLDVPAKASDKPPSVDPPAPQPIVHTLGQPIFGGTPLFAVISAGRDRVTMINSETKERATFKMPKAATEIIPIVGAVISLDIKGPEVTRAGFYDAIAKRWYEYDLKEPATEVSAQAGVSMMGGGAGGPLGLSIKGPTVTRLAVFDREEKRWTTQDLREPARGGVSPSATAGSVTYQVGRFLYKYSAIAKKWSVLELERESSAPTAFSRMSGDGKTIITDGDFIHIYEEQSGEWTHIDTREGK